MLQIFSDAGCYDRHCFTATMVLDDLLRCRTFFAEHYTNLATSTSGELLGVINGIEWVSRNCPDEDTITIYCDNLPVATRISEYPRNHSVPSGPMSSLWLHTFILLDRFKYVTVYHVTAHQEAHNPNKACDVLCRALLRPYKAGLLT